MELNLAAQHTPRGARERRWRVPKMLLLVVEVVSVAGLLAATLHLWQVREVLRQDLIVAQEMKIAIRSGELTDNAMVGDGERIGLAAAGYAVTEERLRIPAIGVDSPVFPEYEERWLKRGVVHVGEPLAPGAPGNLVLAGHSDVYGEVFRDLDQLQTGDDVLMLDDSGAYTYRVRETLIVEPDEIWVMLPTSTPTLTLVSCYPYLLGTHRIVVFADLAHEGGG